MSLAGAFAFGYGARAMAQIEDDGPDWFDDMDPLDTLFLGTVFPKHFRDLYEFGNARTAWLRMLRRTPHWTNIERFVSEVVIESEAADLSIDDVSLLPRLAERLEAACLDQRKLPARLLPHVSLAKSRIVAGVAGDLTLPEPSEAARAQAAELFDDFDPGPGREGTCVDDLCAGMSLLARAGFPVRTDSIWLLIALYAALVASDGETFEELYRRAPAWVLGLDEESQLSPITDTILLAIEQELDPQSVVSRLFMLPTFTEAVTAEDRRWHSAPGTDLVEIAVGLGHSRINTRKFTKIRMSPITAADLEHQRRRFEERFGRPPSPEEPLFFDPDADEPTEISEEYFDRAHTDFLRSVNLHPAWISASK